MSEGTTSSCRKDAVAYLVQVGLALGLEVALLDPTSVLLDGGLAFVAQIASSSTSPSSAGGSNDGSSLEEVHLTAFGEVAPEDRVVARLGLDFLGVGNEIKEPGNDIRRLADHLAVELEHGGLAVGRDLLELRRCGAGRKAEIDLDVVGKSQLLESPDCGGVSDLTTGDSAHTHRYGPSGTRSGGEGRSCGSLCYGLLSCFVPLLFFIRGKVSNPWKVTNDDVPSRGSPVRSHPTVSLRSLSII